jgi:hypothetical protein
MGGQSNRDGKKLQGASRGRIEPLWTAKVGSCDVAGYDFQFYKRSNPPKIDDEPVILDMRDCKGL